MSEQAKVNYTEEQIAILQSEATEDNPMTFDRAKTLVDAVGHNPRSIVAKVRSLGLPYKNSERTAKNGDPIVRKSELVAQIAQALEVDESDVESLESATKAALKLVLAGLTQ